jgi:hypothetical protein
MKMRRMVLAAALVLVFAFGFLGAAFAQEQSTGKAAGGKSPVAAIENKTVQLGEVIEGQDIGYTFKIRNTGGTDLQINNVKPG